MSTSVLDLRALGQRVIDARAVQGWTQKDLAKQLGHGAAQPWISNLEQGTQAHIQADTVVRLARVLGVSTDYLLGLDGSQ